MMNNKVGDDMETSNAYFKHIREGAMNIERSFELGDMVVVDMLNDLVGEVTKKSLNSDKEYDYMVYYEGDGACEWCEGSDLREANDLDNWSLTEQQTCF